MSPRPTNSAGKRSRSPKTDSSTSTYFALAMLPNRTGSPLRPRACERLGIPLERRPERIRRVVNIDCGEGGQVGKGDTRRRREEPAIGRDDEDTRAQLCRGPGERLGIGELAGKIEAREKAEDLADRRALVRKLGSRAEARQLPDHRPQGWRSGAPVVAQWAGQVGRVRCNHRCGQGLPFGRIVLAGEASRSRLQRAPGPLWVRYAACRRC
jgi:hypothetical protein